MLIMKYLRIHLIIWCLIRLDNHESVVIPEKKQYAYIKGYNIGFYDTIDPLFSKVKKDGTMSDVNLYVNLTNTTIELVKE